MTGCARTPPASGTLPVLHGSKKKDTMREGCDRTGADYVYKARFIISVGLAIKDTARSQHARVTL